MRAGRSLHCKRQTRLSFWAGLQQPRQTHDTAGDDDGEPAPLDPPVDESESPFADDIADDNDVDSAIDTHTLVQEIIAPTQAIPVNMSAAGLSEELDPGEVVIPVVDPSDLGRSKRRRTANKLYANFVQMSDDDDDAP
jgi:hypothetical protein